MTAWIESIVTFAALCAQSAFLAGKTRLPAGAAPLAALCGAILWLSGAGCLNLLLPAGAVWFALAALAAAWCFKNRARLAEKALVAPSTVFFVLAGAAIITLFALRQPVFTEWDEFSFWGIAPKVVKHTNLLYTVVDTEMRVTSYAPGLVMLSYLFQYLGASFVPWKVYAAYDILLFAIYAAALSGLKKKHWPAAALGGTVLVLLPYLLTVYTRVLYLCTAYLTSYADIPMGLLFGAPLALYFASREKSPALLVTAGLAVAVTCLSKEMGFALALIAAALLCFDLLFVQKRQDVRLLRFSGLPAKLFWCAALCACAVAPYVVWALYRSSLSGVSATELGGDQNMTMFQMLFTGVAELCGVGRTERFSRVMGQMWQAFYTTSLSEFQLGLPGALGRLFNGSGAVIAAVTLGVLALAWWYAGKGRRAGVGWFALWSTLGFAAFYIFTGFTYIYIFPVSSEMTNYNRYIYPYYLGWLLAAVAMLCWSLRGARGRVVGMGALTALAAFSCWRTASFVRPQLSVVDFPESYYAMRAADAQVVGQAKTVLGAQDKVFYVSMGDDGRSWFMDYYEFYPDVNVDYSFDGGSLVTAAQDEDGETVYTYAVPGPLAMPDYFTGEQCEYYTTHGLSPEVLCRYLADTGCTALYLDAIDGAFAGAYGHLFEDGLSSGARVYRIEGGAQDMRFVPVPEGGLRE